MDGINVQWCIWGLRVDKEEVESRRSSWGSFSSLFVQMSCRIESMQKKEIDFRKSNFWLGHIYLQSSSFRITNFMPIITLSVYKGKRWSLLPLPVLRYFKNICFVCWAESGRDDNNWWKTIFIYLYLEFCPTRDYNIVILHCIILYYNVLIWISSIVTNYCIVIRIIHGTTNFCYYCQENDCTQILWHMAKFRQMSGLALLDSTKVLYCHPNCTPLHTFKSIR